MPRSPTSKSSSSTVRLPAALSFFLLCSSSLPSRVVSFLPRMLSTTTPSTTCLPRLHVVPSSFYYGDGLSSPSSNEPKNATDFYSALCIVPPTRDWDRLQRSRHYARDALFHQWPPAIRLFHPFVAGALDVAQVVEELELEPFEITLDTWVIVPNLEAMDATWKASQTLPLEQQYYEYRDPQKEDDEKVRKLIEKEERIGRKKAKTRAKNAQKRATNEDDENSSNTTTTTETTKDDKYENLSKTFQDQQQLLFEEFGGPCILCLEPNEESKQVLQELREELALLLNHPTTTSPSSIYSCGKYIIEPSLQPDEFRPLIPIATFESNQAALQVARRLKGLWGDNDPLKFMVNELHLVSCRDDFDDYSGLALYSSSSSSRREEEATYLSSGVTSRSPTSNEWMAQQQWGCNAKIMLMGKEKYPMDHLENDNNNDDSDDNEQDDDSIAQRIQQLLDDGEAGGNDISNDYTILDDEEELDSSDIELWLDNDEDWDEGMEVIIGRTHFYTGDQRNYKGMPASSVVDSKDRSMGDVGGSASVSGLARRRRTTTRNTGIHQWDDGEYGRRESDYLPWNKRDKAYKKMNGFLGDEASSTVDDDGGVGDDDYDASGDYGDDVDF